MNPPPAREAIGPGLGNHRGPIEGNPIHLVPGVNLEPTHPHGARMENDDLAPAVPPDVGAALFRSDPFGQCFFLLFVLLCFVAVTFDARRRPGGFFELAAAAVGTS